MLPVHETEVLPLKRYIAREVYRVLLSSTTVRPPPIKTASRLLEADIA
jgi:hypothetical protein